MANKIKLLR